MRGRERETQHCGGKQRGSGWKSKGGRKVGLEMSGKAEMLKERWKTSSLGSERGDGGRKKKRGEQEEKAGMKGGRVGVERGMKEG